MSHDKGHILAAKLRSLPGSRLTVSLKTSQHLLHITLYHGHKVKEYSGTPTMVYAFLKIAEKSAHRNDMIISTLTDKDPVTLCTDCG